jgi:type I site-specific restriction endonuclease
MDKLFKQIKDNPRTHEQEMFARRRETGKSKKILESESSSESESDSSDDVVEKINVSPSRSTATWTEENLTHKQELKLKFGQGSESSGTAQVSEAKDQVKSPSKKLARDVQVERSAGGKTISLELKNTKGDVSLAFSIPTSVLGHGAVLNQLLGIGNRSLRPDEIIVNFKTDSPSCLACGQTKRETSTTVI